MEMAEIVYVRDANGNLVQTTIEDLRENRLEQLEEENKKLKENRSIEIETCNRYREKCEQLEEENKKLKSDLEECECSMHFENDEVGYRKRECKKLKKEKEELKKEVERLQKVLYTITGSRDDGEPDLYEDYQ